jgi:TatD DNase family protein
MQIDIHSHRLNVKDNQKQFLTLEPSFSSDFKDILDLYEKDAFLSVGVHPWKATNWDSAYENLLLQLFSDSRISLIGEIGLDKACLVPFNKQQEAYGIQLDIADYLGKPVLLHVVHAMAEIIASTKNHPNIPAWIIHGFRGGKQELAQYVAKGFYISFGINFKSESLALCPLDKLFLETDDNDSSVSYLYSHVATLLGFSVERVEQQIERNFRTVFPKLL